MRTKFIVVILFMLLPFAGEAAASQKPTVKFRNRTLIDFGYFGYEGYNRRIYPSVADLRLGVKVEMDRVAFKVDVGLSGSKISIKDLIFDFKLDPQSYLTIGNAFEPFSPENFISSVDYRFNNAALPSEAIASGRCLGVTYYRHGRHYFGAVGVYSDNNISDLFTPKETSTAMALTTRHLYRSDFTPNSFFQIGGAVSARTVDKTKRSVEFSSPGYSAILGEDVFSATVEDASYDLKLGIESFGYFGRFMYQAEYLQAKVLRQNGFPSYNIYGGYVQLSFMLNKKGEYGYDSALAIPVRPRSGSVELASRIEYLNATYGGEQTNVMIGVNWFFKRYFALKWSVNYAISDVSGKNGISSVLRTQFTF